MGVVHKHDYKEMQLAGPQGSVHRAQGSVHDAFSELLMNWLIGRNRAVLLLREGIPGKFRQALKTLEKILGCGIMSQM